MNVLFFFVAISTLLPIHITAKEKLTKYSANTYSQFGEDGILEKIFEIIGTTSKTCVEFGAHDGLSCSNTAKLWKNGWKAILIEANKKLYETCCKNSEGYNCICINTHVGYKAHDSLEYILKQHTIVEEIDFLSIDIDGNDYYILESLTTLKPRVIACEFNPTIPLGIDLYQEKNSNMGCSATALIRLAQSLGYRLVAMTLSNCIFIREELFDKFCEFETSPENLVDDTFFKYYITAYNGDCCMIGKADECPWGPNNRKYTKKIHCAYKILNNF